MGRPEILERAGGEFPSVITGRQEFPDLPPRGWRIVCLLVSAQGSVLVEALAEQVAASRKEITNNTLPWLRKKLTGIGKILRVTSRSEINRGKAPSYRWVSEEGIDSSELIERARRVVDSLPKNKQLWTVAEILKEAQRRGLAINLSNFRYFQNRVYAIIKDSGIQSAGRRQRFLAYREEEAREILAQISFIRIRRRKAPKVVAEKERQDWNEFLSLSLEGQEALRINVTNCLLSHFACHGDLTYLNKKERVTKDPRVILGSYLTDKANSKLEALPPSELAELSRFLVWELFIPTLEGYWEIPKENFSDQGIKRTLLRHVSKIKEEREFSLGKVIKEVCNHFSVEIPEKYTEEIVDKTI